jgi:triosephosphate isomerase
VCPPYPYLGLAGGQLSGSVLAWGAQDVCAHDDGAYTGEVSAAMLADLGCTWVIVGHSERRSLFGEGDALVAAKAAAASQSGRTKWPRAREGVMPSLKWGDDESLTF